MNCTKFTTIINTCPQTHIHRYTLLPGYMRISSVLENRGFEKPTHNNISCIPKEKH